MSDRGERDLCHCRVCEYNRNRRTQPPTDEAALRALVDDWEERASVARDSSAASSPCGCGQRVYLECAKALRTALSSDRGDPPEGFAKITRPEDRTLDPDHYRMEDAGDPPEEGRCPHCRVPSHHKDCPHRQIISSKGV